MRQAPLWRAVLGRLSERRWVLVLVLHHIICDGWSMGVIWKELSVLYARHTGHSEAGELPAAPAYPDHARWRLAQAEGESGERLRQHWRRELAGARLGFDLPCQRPRPDQLSGAGGLLRIPLPESVAKRLRRVATELASTPAQVLMAGFAVWLARLCDQRDLVLPVSNSHRVRPEDAGVVGPVGEASLIRLAVADETTFDALLTQVGERLLSALEHHGLPLGGVLRALSPDHPGAISSPPVLFSVVTTPEAMLNLPGVAAVIEGLPVRGVARTELYVVLIPSGDGFDVCFEYSTDLFDEEAVAGWQADFIAVLDQVTSDPRIRVAEPPAEAPSDQSTVPDVDLCT